MLTQSERQIPKCKSCQSHTLEIVCKRNDLQLKEQKQPKTKRVLVSKSQQKYFHEVFYTSLDLELFEISLDCYKYFNVKSISFCLRLLYGGMRRSAGLRVCCRRTAFSLLNAVKPKHPFVLPIPLLFIPPKGRF